MDTEVEKLTTILQPYIADPKTPSLLALQCYEVFDGSQKYIEKFQKLLSPPREDEARREALAETLSEISVLVEDTIWHAEELRKEIDKALDEIDADGENEEAPITTTSCLG